MDRFHENMARWILVTSVVVVMAMLGVLAHFWWNRPTSPPPPRRGTGPILVNEPDGSVYDLTLKLSLLEDRLMRVEQRTKQQAEENAALRRENERVTRELRELA